MNLDIRRATHDDYEAVASFTRNTWPDHGGDYLADVYHDWLEAPGDDRKKTFLAEVQRAGSDLDDGSGDEDTATADVAGVVQAVMLASDEAWFQGMRVNPDYRGQGVASRLNEATYDWARAHGATVARVLTFSWNTPALGVTRADGFEPICEFRWAHVEPDAAGDTGADTDGDGAWASTNDPTDAWRYWTHCDVREEMRGLALDDEQSWALRELTSADLQRYADETAVFAVRSEDGLAGVSFRVRTFERTADTGEAETWAEYGVGAWDSVDAARLLFAAIARDAAAIGADRTRVAIPETPRYVSDAVYAGATVSENPTFVLGIDLTRR